MSINSLNYALAKKDWDKAYEDLSVLEVGGRNLLRNSGNFASVDGWSKGEVVTKNEHKAIEVSGGSINMNSNLPILEPNTCYVYSGWLMSSEDYDPNDIEPRYPLHFQAKYDGSDTDGYASMKLTNNDYPYVIPANTWFKITTLIKTREENESDDIEFKPYVYTYSGNIINNKYWLRDFKLEKGNKATPWTPAPEDINAHPFVTKMAEISHLSKLNNEQTEENANAITEGGAS